MFSLLNLLYRSIMKSKGDKSIKFSFIGAADGQWGLFDCATLKEKRQLFVYRARVQISDAIKRLDYFPDLSGRTTHSVLRNSDVTNSSPSLFYVDNSNAPSPTLRVTSVRT